MAKNYTNQENVLILISLLKQYGIKKIIASPGTVNIPFVEGVQFDPFFEVFSSVDERSAAYMACGMAAESGEPVVITCTGATASRNYIPGLTEAYYRKLPVIAVTGTINENKIGHLIPQVMDRSRIQKDIAVCSLHLPSIKEDADKWQCTIDANKALIAANKRRGPVHINLETRGAARFNSDMFKTTSLPNAKKIGFYTLKDKLPSLPDCRIAVFIGAHVPFDERTTIAIDSFCERNNAVVFCDHTSNYRGKYRIMSALLGQQRNGLSNGIKPELVIHIGEISGDYASTGFVGCCHQVWRVSEDGILKDTFGKLSSVFEMTEAEFFENYGNGPNKDMTYHHNVLLEYSRLLEGVSDDLPFSNIWVAKNIHKNLPRNSVLHLGILNSLRSWNLFDSESIVRESCNTGGFGIDGGVSTLLGASLVHKDTLYYGVFGDLAFFYDMNSIGNRFVGKNLRIMIVNNGDGAEFKLYHHFDDFFGESVDDYIAAKGHFGKKSPNLVKHYAEDLGFKYLTSSSKDEFKKTMPDFIVQTSDKPILFEVFTTSEDESAALYAVDHIAEKTAKNMIKDEIRSVIGKRGVRAIKKIINR